MAYVYVSIGSNIRPEQNVRAAVRALRERFGGLAVSPVYRSASVGFDGSDFLNLVVGFRTELEPLALAEELRALESAQGRVRGGEKFSARTLDLDILTYDDRVLQQGRLVLPRDEITRYAFVLRPLADLAGERLHPELGVTYAALWASFDDTQQSMEPVEMDFDARD